VVAGGTEYEGPFVQVAHSDEVRRKTEVDGCPRDRVRHGMACLRWRSTRSTVEELPVWDRPTTSSANTAPGHPAVAASTSGDFEFAPHLRHPHRVVVEPEKPRSSRRHDEPSPYTGPGVLIQSGPFTADRRLPRPGEGVDEVIGLAGEEAGRPGTVNYRVAGLVV